MKDLSLHILDIANNSVKAGASRIVIDITETPENLSVKIADNGKGMEPEFLAKVADPFTTTRDTRKVGLGIPLLKMAAEMTGGGLSIESEPGKGTTLIVTFKAGHIDTPPAGDIPATVTALIHGSPDIDFYFTHTKPEGFTELDTAVIREALDGVPLSEPDVLEWIEKSLREG